MRGKLIMFADFRGGLNTEAGSYEIAANQCRDARNVVSTATGALKKRHGSDVFVTFGESMTSLFAGTLPDTTIAPPPPPPPPPGGVDGGVF